MQLFYFVNALQNIMVLKCNYNPQSKQFFSRCFLFETVALVSFVFINLYKQLFWPAEVNMQVLMHCYNEWCKRCNLDGELWSLQSPYCCRNFLQPEEQEPPCPVGGDTLKLNAAWWTPLHSLGAARVPLCFVPLISRRLSPQCVKAAAADRAFVLPFQKRGWCEMGFVGRELVTGRSAGRQDDSEAALFAGTLRRWSLD